jgi:hypothetical protein
MLAMSLSEYFGLAWPLLLGFLLVEIAILDPLFQIVKYQTYHYGRFFLLRRILNVVAFDTSKWEPDNPAAMPGPTGGVAVLLLLTGLILIFSQYVLVGLGALASVAFIFVGMHYRDLNKKYER